MLAKLDQLLKFGDNEQVLEILAIQNSLSLEERIYKARALEMRFDESIFEAEEIINDVIHQLKPLNDKILELKARSTKLHILLKFLNFRLIQQELDAWIHLWEQCTVHEKDTLKQNYAAYLTAKSVTDHSRTTDSEVWNSASQEIKLVIEIFEYLDDYHDVSWALYLKFMIERDRENKEAFQETLSSVLHS
ncbi:MAG: hypothetical protein ACFFCQ_04650 [Promethearchaeota archaeon]